MYYKGSASLLINGRVLGYLGRKLMLESSGYCFAVDCCLHQHGFLFGYYTSYHWVCTCLFQINYLSVSLQINDNLEAIWCNLKCKMVSYLVTNSDGMMLSWSTFVASQNKDSKAGQEEPCQCKLDPRWKIFLTSCFNVTWPYCCCIVSPFIFSLIVAPSRRGDLEILGYCIVQWLCSQLPWEDKLSDKKYVSNEKNRYAMKLSHFFMLWFHMKMCSAIQLL